MKKSKLNIFFNFIYITLSIIQTLVYISLIAKYLGVVSIGYVSFISALMNILTIFTIILTTQSNKNIVIDLHNCKWSDAHIKLSSYIISLFFMSLFITIVVILTSNIYFTNVLGYSKIPDLEIVMLLSMTSFIFSNLNIPLFSIYYFENKMYYLYAFSSLNYIFKIIIPLIVLNVSTLSTWHLFIGAFISDFFIFLFNILYNNSFFLKQGIKTKLVKINSHFILDCFKSGIWISYMKIGSILTSNALVFLISSFYGFIFTGIVATIQQFINFILFSYNSITSLVIPNLIKLYSFESKHKLESYLETHYLLFIMLISLIVGVTIVNGQYFFSIWVGESFLPYRIHILFLIFPLPFILPTDLVHQFNLINNNIKGSSRISMYIGLLNIGLLFLFLRYTRIPLIWVLFINSVSSIITSVFIEVWTIKTSDVFRVSFFFKSKFFTIIQILISTIICFAFGKLIFPNTIAYFMINTFCSSITILIIYIVEIKILKININKVFLSYVK